MEQRLLKKLYFSNLCEKKYELQLDIDDIISRLLRLTEINEQECDLNESEITNLIIKSRELFLSQSAFLELTPPLIVIGDIHGQYSDLIRWFEICGYPPHSNYLFLGDYINRGIQSIVTICLLMAYKIKFPEKVFLLRGNHECGDISFVYGFYDACVKKYSINLWKTFISAFDCLPLAALINDTIFCVHGGISPVLYDFDQIRSIARPVKVPQDGLICDLLWSDPDKEYKYWSPNEFRGVSYSFGRKAVNDFIQKHGLELICRGHQVVEDGYSFFCDKKLLTLFSAPNYSGEFYNAGAVLIIDEKMACSFKILRPRKKNKAVRLLYKNITHT